ncbi:MAG: hypothetical protein ISR76_00730 [Planctomycetes bacterium]|nr:hypothetical protein [Planctomycetota bacterium]MBL7007496.1 hypothetical protein [Planctomycetota bacterium]
MAGVSTVLVAELAEARTRPRRDRLASQVEEALVQVHERWPEEWIARPVTRPGPGGVCGVLRRPLHAFDVCVALNEAVWPRRFQAAVVTGSLSRAVGTLARGRRDGLPCAFDLAHLDRRGQDLLEAMARLHGAVLRSWKPSRFRAVTAMRRAATQREAAAALGVTQQSISEALRAAQFAEMASAEAALRGFLASPSPVHLGSGS